MTKVFWAATVAVLAVSGTALGQMAGSSTNTTTVGLTVSETKEVAFGWSAKKTIFKQPVYNDQQQKIGTVDDIIVAPDTSVSYFIIGAGGFAGLGKHNVAIPVAQVQLQGDKLILPGATKTAIQSMPPFEYAPNRRMENVAGELREKREAYEKAVARKLEEFDRDLLVLKQDVQSKSAEIKTRAQEELADLDRKREAVAQRLTDLRRAQSEAWGELRTGMDKAVEELKHGLAEAKQKMRTAG